MTLINFGIALAIFLVLKPWRLFPGSDGADDISEPLFDEERVEPSVTGRTTFGRVEPILYDDDGEQVGAYSGEPISW